MLYCKKLIINTHNILKILIILTLVNFLMYFNLYSQISSGGYSESYLLRDVGARHVSLCGAYSGISNDPMTIFYNPAGLAYLSDRPVVSTMVSVLEFNRTHSAIAWGQSFFENFGFGFAINSFNTGSFTARDIRGNPLGDYSNWQFDIVAGASYNIEFASVGVALKYLSNSLQGSGTGADGISLDIGTKFNVYDIFSFGLSVQNASSYLSWNTPSDEYTMLPYTIRTGVAMEYGLNNDVYETRNTVTGETEEIVEPASRYILFAIDAVLSQHDNGPSIILGIEAVPHEIIAFRGGISLAGDDLGEWKLFPMNIWGGGVSIRPDFSDLPFKFSVDYSISSDHISVNKIGHHIALTFEF